MLCNVIDNGRLIRRLIIAFLTSEALMLCNVIVNQHCRAYKKPLVVIRNYY